MGQSVNLFPFIIIIYRLIKIGDQPVYPL